MDSALYYQVSERFQQFRQLYQQGEFEQAIQAGRQLRSFAQQHCGKCDPDYIHLLNDLAIDYKYMANYEESEILFKEITSSLRYLVSQPAARLDYLIELGNAWLNCAGLYREWGDYRQAMEACEEALGAYELALSAQYPGYEQVIYSRLVTALNNTSSLLVWTGSYKIAAEKLEHALQIASALFSGRQQAYIASMLIKLGSIYNHLGNREAAIQKTEAALSMTQEMFGHDHPECIPPLSYLPSLYRGSENPEKMGALVQAVREIYARLEQNPAEQEFHHLHNLASLLESVGEESNAQATYQQVLQKIKGSGTGKQLEATVTLLNYAYFQTSHDCLNDAIQTLQEALDIRQRYLGPDHPNCGEVLQRLADLYIKTGKEQEAIACLTQATAITWRQIHQVFSTATESVRLDYWKTIQDETRLFMDLVLRFKQTPAIVQQGFDLIVQRKGINFDYLRIQKEVVLQDQFPELATRLQDLVVTRRNMAQVTLSGPQGEDIATYQNKLNQLERRRQLLEAELSRAIPQIALENDLGNATGESIAAALPEGTALVEIVRTSRYLAFILLAGQPGKVSLIDLGEAFEIDQWITRYRNSITGEVDARKLEVVKTRDEEESDAGLGDTLRQTIFDPIVQCVGDSRHHLFVAPDGDLCRLPLEVLPLEQDRFVIDEYSISYLSTGRDVLRFGQQPGHPSTAPLVIADPNFDLASQPGGEQGEKVNPSALGRLRAVDRSGLSFQPLAGTRQEGNIVAELLGVEALMGDEALESRLKACRSPRILHLATHGFFLENQALTKQPDSAEQRERLTGRGLENPMLRSGLALAGANTWLRNGALPPEAEDGILTAEDVAGLDLSNTDLTVLSACETGLGDIQTGEGVFGLRRAFILAGTKTLIMSLWNVPDKETQQLMESFYELAIQGKPYAEALRETQLNLKMDNNLAFYWGAFVFQGEI